MLVAMVLLVCSAIIRGWSTTAPTSFRRCNRYKRALFNHPTSCMFLSTTNSSSSYDATYKNYVDGIQNDSFLFNGTVTILEMGEHHVVVDKPPGVVCHHSDWSGSRSSRKTSKRQGLRETKSFPEVPMLQRAREAVGERVNLIHRLDRGASGCLLLSLAKSDENGGNATAVLQEAMTSSVSKTYLALVRGEGILKGRDFRKEGWFQVDRPIKDESGTLKNATSHFRFIAGQDNGNGTLTDRPRVSLVLARIETGRWHQIRKHLNGLSHPIIGDSSHGNSKTNREWKEKWGLLPERTCLHLLHLQLPPTAVSPRRISITSSVAPDMMAMMQNHLLPEIMKEAMAALEEEDLCLESSHTATTVGIQLDVF